MIPGAWEVIAGDLLPSPVPRVVSRLARLRALEDAAGAPTVAPGEPSPYRAAPLPPMCRRGALRIGFGLVLSLREARGLWLGLSRCGRT